MSYEIRRVEPSRWDALVARFPERTVFHQRAWLDAVGESYGFRVNLVAALRNGETVAIWPSVEKRKGPFRVLGSPLPGTSTPYLGPLFAEEADVPGVLAACIDDRILGRYSFFACRTQERARRVDLSEHGFSELLRFETYLIDLRLGEDELWSNLKSECRNRIRKARTAGLTIRLEDGPEFLDDFWTISLGVFGRRKRQPTFTRRFLEAVWRRLAATGNICVLSAFLEGRRVGTLVLPHDDHFMYYWAGGTFAEHLQAAPNNLLHWEAILEARRRGLRQYDFISSKGSAGRFKKTFGPQARCVATHWEHSPSGLLRLLKDRYEKRLRRKRRVVR